MSLASARALPAIEKLLHALEPHPVPRPLAVHLVRRHVADLRRRAEVPAFDAILATLRLELDRLGRSRLQPLINATGILAHTNLGRAPLAASAVAALDAIAAGYSNLEFDLESGERGSRGRYLEAALAVLCDAEAATIVNNCAAALVLALHHFAAGPRREVVISRGELIQIGGGFRIPEILEASGARLREVGTTNRTTIDDYDRAIGPETALVLRVHRSNFYQEGFVDSPRLEALVDLVRGRGAEFAPPGLPLLEDLGSGALVPIEHLAPIDPEPRPQASVHAGVDLVCFSGDKLLGGPQAGILVGREPLVAALRRDPLFRALRCDKLVFAALQATIDAYLTAAARRDLGAPLSVPMLEMLHLRPEDLGERADRVAARLARMPVDADLIENQAQIGGGVCPRSSIPSFALRLRPHQGSVSELAARLRRGTPPIVGRLRENALELDFRTVAPADDARLGDALLAALSPPSP